MAYIHVKRIGDRNYYTLRISVRKGNKVVTKDLCNLGSDLSKINLENLEKRHKTEVRSSYRTIKRFLDSNHYLEKVKRLKLKKTPYYDGEQLSNIKAIKEHFNKRFLKLDALTQKDYYEDFLIKFAVNTTSIEGNTITLKEADRLLKEDIIPKNRTMREAYDLTNTKKAVIFLMEEKPNLSLELIEQIHDMLLENIDNRKGYRTHDINIFGQPFKPSPAKYIKADLKLLLDWYNGNKKKIHPLALVTFFHHKFENIHPFSDGNGRTGRVIMNYLLSFFSYPPFIISRRFRKRYLDSMNKADKSLKKSLTNIDIKYYHDLTDFVYQEFKSSYWDTFLV
tara:strand:- start:713 stop:1723 length:1011 start_codon:yes stop_codon:yes gene_type:complete